MTDVLVVAGLVLPAAVARPLEARRRRFSLSAGPLDSHIRIRGIVAGPGSPPAVLSGLVGRAREQGAPVLLCGRAASMVAGFGSNGEGVTAQLAFPSEIAASDALTDGVMPGATFLAEAGVAPAELAAGFEPLLLTASGRVLLARGEGLYVTVIRPDVAPEQLAGDGSGVDPASTFALSHAAALVSRFVDAVVGRTDEEIPWGRRGPGPVPAPGLVLNPA